MWTWRQARYEMLTSRLTDADSCGRTAMNKFQSWSPRVLAVLRIVTALLFMEHGLMKLFAIPAPQPGVPHPLPLILVVAAWLEVAGSPLLVLGLFTRPVAFLLSGE